VGVSESILEIYRRAGRLAPGQGTVVYNLPPPSGGTSAVPRAEALRALGLPDRPLVVYVGKLSPGKGAHIFLEAASLVVARVPDACFALVGDGAVPRATPDADVRFLGSRPHSDVEILYTLADVVVHPAVWPEPFSRVPLEAAAAGKAVVGTRVGGTPEAVEDKVTGLLVERNDGPALADAIVRLLTDGSLREALGRNAREFIGRKFAADEVVARLLAAYRERRA